MMTPTLIVTVSKPQTSAEGDTTTPVDAVIQVA